MGVLEFLRSAGIFFLCFLQNKDWCIYPQNYFDHFLLQNPVDFNMRIDTGTLHISVKFTAVLAYSIIYIVQ